MLEHPHFLPSNLSSVLAFRMVAAVWNTCYPSNRSFVTEWRREGTDRVKLIDAADNGGYSFQVEGLLVRYLLGFPPMPSFLPLVWHDDGVGRGAVPRDDWHPTDATPEQWEALRTALYQAFYENGAGFFAHDLKFADLAIDRLKQGLPVEAGACSRLPETNDEAENFA